MRMKTLFALALISLIIGSCSKSNTATPSPPTASVPVVNTISSITTITAVSAVSGGNISSDGGAGVTSRGVCWNTLSNPTIANSKSVDGSGTGLFSSNLTGL